MENYYRSLNSITAKFRDLSTQKEIQHLFLEMLVDHIKVGIVSFDENEKVYLLNNSFKQLTNKVGFGNLSTLETYNKPLVTAIREISPGATMMIKLETHETTYNLALRANNFKLEGKSYKLISVQDIKSELEEQELDSWQKLIRVLTHEIMNSVTPITSLTDTLVTMLSNSRDTGEVNDEVLENILQGLNAIGNRSKGLKQFTEAYRNLTRIPLPERKEIKILPMVEEIKLLLFKQVNNLKVNFIITCNDPELTINADPNLLEQVLINLIKNSVEALLEVDHPTIEIVLSKNDGKTLIKIIDNGIGMEKEVLEKVFIPFYTTKNSGSGIGLALSRQIIQKHQGKIRINSIPGAGTEVKLLF